MTRTARIGFDVPKTLAVAALILAGAAIAGAAPNGPERTQHPKDLRGWLLVAAPGMPDPRFAKTVIFMIRHGAQGAMGLIVNRVIGEEPARKFLAPGTESDPAAPQGRTLLLLSGGPVGTDRGFILHSSEYPGTRSVKVTETVSLTTSPEILRAIAAGKGPEQALFAVGYAGWGPGQLEAELDRKDWVVVPGDTKLLFDRDMPGKWQRAFDRRGFRL